MYRVDDGGRRFAARRDVRTVDVRDFQSNGMSCRHKPEIAISRDNDLGRTNVDAQASIESESAARDQSFARSVYIDQPNIQLHSMPCDHRVEGDGWLTSDGYIGGRRKRERR